VAQGVRRPVKVLLDSEMPPPPYLSSLEEFIEFIGFIGFVEFIEFIGFVEFVGLKT